MIILAGPTQVSRVGLSMLTNVQLENLVAETPDDYVRRAVELANDIPRLMMLRAELQERFRTSPLMDAIGFARDFEEACRLMWRGHLQEPGTT